MQSKRQSIISDIPGDDGWPWTELQKPNEPNKCTNCDKPKITIVTPSYNQGEFLEETIRFVLLQNYDNFEFLIIDGGSSDNSIEIIKKYEPWIKYWVSEKDNGQTNAINKGWKHATGDIIAYLNSDDIYCEGTFHIVANYFMNNPEIDMIYGDIIHIDKESNVIEYKKSGKIDTEKYLSTQFYLPQPTVFFRKKILDEIGYLDEQFHLAMDLDYWVRILHKYDIGYIQEYLACARIYPETKSKSEKYKYLDERLIILDKYFSREDIPLNIRKKRRKIYANVLYRGAIDYLNVGDKEKARKILIKTFFKWPFIYFEPEKLFDLFFLKIRSHEKSQ